MVLGTNDPTWCFAGEAVWRALRTPDGPATMRFGQHGDRITVEVWGAGAAWAAPRAAAMLGDPGPGELLANHDHLFVRRLARNHPGIRVGASLTLVDSAQQIILGQRVTAGEAVNAWRQMTRDHGSRAPGAEAPEGLMLPIPSSQLALLGTSGLHRYGIDGQRARAMIQIARHRVRLDRLVSDPGHIDSEELIRVLSLIAGIGPWTRTSLLSTACGDPDAVIVGDLHLPNHVCWALTGTRGGDEQMHRVLEPFAPARGLAQRLIARHSAAPPRRGPRYRPLPMTRM